MPVVLKAEAAERRGRGPGERAERRPALGREPRPARPAGAPAALDAIATADQIVIGPGSLFTSVLAAVVVPDIREALAATKAQKVYVANLRPQIPETAGYDVAAHVDALVAHGLDVDVVLAHTDERPLDRADGLAHDPARLAEALRDLVV